jgi:hypothetical protein
LELQISSFEKHDFIFESTPKRRTRMPVTTQEIRRAFNEPLRRIPNDATDRLRTALMEPSMESSRAQIIVDYGVEEFIRQWANRVQRRLEAGHFPAGNTPSSAWEHYGRSYIQIFAGGPNGDRRILLPLSRFTLQAGGNPDADREPLWIEYWLGYFQNTTFPHPVEGLPQQTGNPRSGPRDAPANGGVARIALWALRHWSQFGGRASPLGQSAAMLRRERNFGSVWEAPRNEHWSRTLWVLSETAATRRHGLPHGTSYFQQIYSGYRFAFGQLCSDSLTLQDAALRGRREPETLSRMQSNLGLWKRGGGPQRGRRGTGAGSLLDTLTPPNLQRFNRIDQGFRDYWSQRRSVPMRNRELRQYGMEIASGGGLGLIHWNLEAR